MNDERIQRINEIVEDWSAMLNLTDWDIRYNPDAASDSDSWATISVRPAERVASIAVASDVEDNGIEGSVVHELLHIVLLPMQHMTESLVAQVRDVGAQAVMAERLEDVLEQTIETLTRSLVPTAPRLLVGKGERWDVWNLWR